MKIKISSLPARGISFEEEMDKDALNARLNESQTNDITIEIAPKLSATVTKCMDGAEFKGKMEGVVKQACSSCAEELNHNVSAKIDYTLKPLKAGEVLEDDIGISYFEDDHFETTNLCEETLIMSLSPFWKPELDENEFCKQCGKNCKAKVESTVSTTVKLADLFKKAGVN